MEWWQRFGVAASALGDAFGSAWDIVHSPDHNDPNAQRDILGLLIRVPVGLGNAAFQTVAAPVQGLYQGATWVGDRTNQVAATPFLAQSISNSPTFDKMTPDNGFFNGDTWQAAWDEANRTSVFQALMFANAGPKLEKLMGAPKDNPLALNSSIDVLNKDQRIKAKDDTLFNVITGLGDATFTWYADPLGKGLEAAGAAKRVSKGYGVGAGPNDPWLEKLLFNRTGFGTKELNPDLLARSDAVDEFLHWAQGKPAWMVKKHPMIAAMANPDDGAGIISVLIGRDGVGDIEDARKVIALGYGSDVARTELLSKNNDLTAQLNNIENLQNPAFRLALAEADPSQLYTDTYLQQHKKYLDDLAKGIIRNPPPKRYREPLSKLSRDQVTTDALQKAITAAIGENTKAAGIQGHMINQAPKVGQANKADRLVAYDQGSFSSWNEQIFPKPFAPALKIISWPAFKFAHQFTDKRPPSWIDPNRKETSAALWAYMKTSKAFDDNTIQEHTNEFLEALDISSRRSVIEKVEGDAIVRLALKHGIDMDTAKAIASEGIGRKNSLIEKARLAQSEGRVYGVTDDDGNMIRIPAFETQEVNSVPLADLEAYDRIFKKHTGMIKALGWANKYNGSAKQLTTELFDAFTSVWSAINLLRPGYTIRNITDDSLRTLASLGAMNMVGQISAGVKNGLGTNVHAHAKNTGIRAKMLAESTADRQGGYAEGLSRKDISDSIRGRVDQMGRDLHSLKLQSNDGFVYDGHNYKGPYAGAAGGYERVVGSDFSSISGTTGAMVAQLRNDFAIENAVSPGDPGHLSSWAHDIQNVIGHSEIGKKFLEGMTGAEVKDWLVNNPYGRAARRKLGSAGKDVDALVGRAQAVVDQYVPLMRNLPDPFILRKMALNDKIDDKVLEDLFPDVDLRPVVHGPTIALNLSVGAVSDAFHGIIDKGFRWFGSIPTDKLIRHPTFRSMMIGNVRRLHDNLARQKTVQKFTDDDFARIEHAAREMSLKQLNGLLFDGSTKSNIAHKLRFMTGFFSAWEDSVTKWAKIAYDKPETLVNGMKLWNAPNQMNLGSTADPTDPNKRVPRWQVLKLDEETGEWNQAGKDWDIWSINDPNVVIQARLPAWIRDYIPFATEDDGSVTIPKSTLNLSLQGDPWWLPGAGPITNMAVSKYVEQHPTTLPEVYKWAIPFGGESNAVYGLLPAWSRRLWTSGESITNGTRASTFINILETQEMKIKLQLRKPPKSHAEFMKEIEERTDSFFKLRAFTSFFSPVAVQYNSPFKFYIDQYRALQTKVSKLDIQKELAARESDPGHYVPVTADELFLETYGEDFYGFVTSVSKNNLGAPASAGAWNKSQSPEVQKYIQAGELDKAALAMGEIEDTAFNQYVYDSQFHQNVGGPGSSKTAREHQSPEESIKQNKVRLGWTKYTQMMDLLDGMQFDQGMDPDFVDFVRTKVARTLAVDFDDQGRPKLNEWGTDFYNTDPEKVPTTIRNFQNFINDNEKLVMNRPDLRVLGVYLTERQRLLNVLEQRKASGGDGTLQARSNADLAQKWKNTKVGLAESNTVFGRIFWRYLSNDRLQVSTLDKK